MDSETETDDSQTDVDQSESDSDEHPTAQNTHTAAGVDDERFRGILRDLCRSRASYAHRHRGRDPNSSNVIEGAAASNVHNSRSGAQEPNGCYVVKIQTVDDQDSARRLSEDRHGLPWAQDGSFTYRSHGQDSNLVILHEAHAFHVRRDRGQDPNDSVPNDDEPMGSLGHRYHGQNHNDRPLDGDEPIGSLGYRNHGEDPNDWDLTRYVAQASISTHRVRGQDFNFNTQSWQDRERSAHVRLQRWRLPARGDTDRPAEPSSATDVVDGSRGGGEWSCALL